MKPCRSTRTSMVTSLLGIAVFSIGIFLGIYSTINLILSTISSPQLSTMECVTTVFIALAALTSTSALVFFLVNFIKMETRKYAVSKDGLCVGSTSLKFFPWSEVSEVAVVRYGASASLQNYQSVICVFLEEKHKDTLEKLLRNNFWGVLHQKSTIIIDLTPATIRDFLTDYPGIITDYRES